MQDALHEKATHGTASFPLQVYSYKNSGSCYQVLPHWHEEFEWLYVEEGVLTLNVHGVSHLLSTGDFCFINSGELHGLSADAPSIHHAIVFRPSLLDFALYDACQHNFIRPVTAGQLLLPAPGSGLNTGGVQSEILLCLKQVVTLYHTLPRGALLSIKVRLLQILECLFSCEALKENSLTDADRISQDRLRKAIEFMKNNYMQPISLKTLGGLCYMTPAWFCHYFKKETGKTPIQYLNEYRIQEAARMLLETELQVSEIALACGFDNISYFIRKFKECRQITPKQYRLQNCME